MRTATTGLLPPAPISVGLTEVCGTRPKGRSISAATGLPTSRAGRRYAARRRGFGRGSAARKRRAASPTVKKAKGRLVQAGFRRNGGVD